MFAIYVYAIYIYASAPNISKTYDILKLAKQRKSFKKIFQIL